MAINTELLEKVSGSFEFLYKYELILDEKANCLDKLDEANTALTEQKSSFKWCIGTAVVCLGGFTIWNTSTTISGMMGWLAMGLFLVGAIALIRIPIAGLKIPGKKKAVMKANAEVKVRDKMIEQLCDNMSQELNDTNSMFTGDTYPPSRHVKMGADAIRSGQVENIKDLLYYLDDVRHKETLEREAKLQTEYARQAANDAMMARISAEMARDKQNQNARDIDNIRSQINQTW